MTKIQKRNSTVYNLGNETKNIIDLQKFRLQKQLSSLHKDEKRSSTNNLSIDKADSDCVSQEINNRLESIKKSISRINKLMGEMHPTPKKKSRRS